MGEAVFLLRAYLKGTRPLGPGAGGSSKKWVRALTLAALIYGFGVLRRDAGLLLPEFIRRRGEMVGHPEWGYAMALLSPSFFRSSVWFSVPAIAVHLP
jgi:hypothetical protein